MTSLKDIEWVEKNIKTVPYKTIKILYKIIFEDDSDRRGRKKIREFTGFKYDKNADEYKNKSAFVKQSFSVAELVTVCNLLHLDYEGRID